MQLYQQMLDMIKIYLQMQSYCTEKLLLYAMKKAFVGQIIDISWNCMIFLIDK